MLSAAALSFVPGGSRACSAFFVFVLTCVSDPLQGLSLFQYHVFLVATTVTPFYDSNTV